MGRRATRRNVLKGIGSSGAAVAALATLTKSGTAWAKIPIDLRCPDCKRLGKIEANYDSDGFIEKWVVEDDWGKQGTAQDLETFTFDADGDGDEETTIKFTDYYTNDGERVGFDLVTDAGLCRVDVKNGGKEPNEYTDLGAVVRGTEFFAPDNPGGDSDSDPDQLSNVKFYYCPTPRVCVLSDDVDFKPTERISVTSDEVRVAVWWGPRHFSDSYLFDNGVKPEIGGVGDLDSDGTDDLCFDFDFADAIINDPLSVRDPRKMKVSLLVRETDDDEDLFVGHTQDGIVVNDPTFQ